MSKGCLCCVAFLTLPASNVSVAFLWKIATNIDILKIGQNGTVTVYRAVELLYAAVTFHIDQSGG